MTLGQLAACQALDIRWDFAGAVGVGISNTQHSINLNVASSQLVPRTHLHRDHGGDLDDRIQLCLREVALHRAAMIAAVH